MPVAGGRWLTYCLAGAVANRRSLSVTTDRKNIAPPACTNATNVRSRCTIVLVCDPQTPQPTLANGAISSSSSSSGGGGDGGSGSGSCDGVDIIGPGSSAKLATTGSDAVGAPTTAAEGKRQKTDVSAVPAAAAPVHAAAGPGPGPGAAAAAAAAGAAGASAPVALPGVGAPTAIAPTAAAAGRAKGSGSGSGTVTSGGEVLRKAPRPRPAVPRVTSERSQRKMLIVSRRVFESVALAGFDLLLHMIHDISASG